MAQNTTIRPTSEPLAPGSVLALAREYMPPKFAEKFLADNLIIFMKPWQDYTDKSKRFTPLWPEYNTYFRAVGRTAGLYILFVIGVRLLCKYHHLLPRTLKVLAVAISISILLRAIYKHPTLEFLFNRCRARALFKGRLPHVMETFASMIHDTARAQWFWDNGKVPLGPIERREKHLDGDWIVLRLARWPEDDASLLSSGEQGVEQQSQSVRKDWDRLGV
ncbi:hypothetical protein B0T17DRAFT_543950 [Bombardia bombarda]|uniref:Uncharacterized protein n=1 Tax=Bombardia bombarda TaxID=252184 RepID=A0AA39TMC1_9PEZI|nr:hypothetical protein B0T17DRAFT_543950 [Bombardia bombarda]